MALRLQTRRLLIAAGIGGAIVLVYAIGVGTRLGWLGVGLVGLIVLYISVRLDLFGGRAVPGIHADKAEMDLLARQFDRDSAASASDDKGSRNAIYLARGIGVLLSVLGFGMFFLQLSG